MEQDTKAIQHELFADAPASWHAAIDAGHDMALVAEAMGRSFEERLSDLERANRMLNGLRSGVRDGRAGHGGSASTTA